MILLDIFFNLSIFTKNKMSLKRGDSNMLMFNTRNERYIMKIRKLTTVLFIAIAVFFLCSCGGGSIREPNNSIDEANQVELDKAYNMKIDEKGDVDWYSVELPSQGYLKVLAKNIPEEIVPEGAIAIYKEWQGDKGEYMKSWTKLPFAVAIHEKGTYHVAVIDNYNDNMSKEPFEIKFSFVDEFDDFELNNKPEDAKGVTLGKENKSAIYPVGDNDWFKVNTEEQGYLTVKARNVPEALELETRYVKYDEYNPDKVEVIRKYGKLPYSVAVPEPGEYFFHILDNYNDKASEQLFDWKIEFTPEMDMAEPNNDLKNAKELKEQDTLKMAIFPKGDVDVYKVAASRAGTLVLKAKDYEKIVPEVRLYMKDTTGKEKLKSVGSWEKLPAQLEIPDTQNEYFVKFIDNYNDAESPKIFTVKAELK